MSHACTLVIRGPVDGPGASSSLPAASSTHAIQLRFWGSRVMAICLPMPWAGAPLDRVGVSNGGDGSSIVSGITWSSWGGRRAVGRGGGDYIPRPGTSNKGYPERAVVVAFDFGECRGRWAYRAYEEYFPEEGQKFLLPGSPICPSL